jgi:protein TonB
LFAICLAMVLTVQTRDPWRGAIALVLALGLHLGGVIGFLYARPMPPPSTPITWISLSAITPQPVPVTPTPQPAVTAPPVVETPAPQPTPVAAVETPHAVTTRPEPTPKPRPKPKPKLKSEPRPKAVRVPQAVPVTTPQALPVAETRPAAKPVEFAPTPAPIAPAQYNAAYLNNPAPAYPALARRLGERGKVLLRTRVLADGSPGTVEVQQSSGSSRLDAAARAAVARWRFVPARQGEIALASWVLVPINFQLEN